jgi:beta-glucosidase
MHPYQDPSLPTERRTQDLLSRMTVEEKVAQLLHPWSKSDAEVLDKYGQTGLGALYVFWVQDRNALQKAMIERSRLGIPVLFVQEALHSGFVNGTIFPMPCALASAWDPALVERAHAVIASDARTAGAHITFSPNIDVHTDPRFGRIEEGWGEDPLLTSTMAAAAVRGLQGNTPGRVDQDHIFATPKHFAAYGRTENGQDGSAADLSERTLREVYLRPFRAAVEAGCGAIMPAHNEINGVPCHANAWLLTHVLRDEWDFRGTVISDYSDTIGLCRYHVASGPEDAAAKCLAAGVDVDMGALCFQALVDAVKAGRVPAALLDRAAANMLRLKFGAGLFEKPYADETRRATLDTPDRRAAALDAARRSLVLLRNEGGLLPLKPGLRSIAVIGPNADDDKAQLGGYTQYGARVVTVLEGIRSAAGPGVTVRHEKGCEIMSGKTDGIPAAVEAARTADVAVLVLGDAKETCQESWGGQPGDAATLDLPGPQMELVRAVHATGTPCVAVLIAGRPHSIAWIAQNVPAILEAWRCGEEGGTAVADVLFGRVNPSGKLAVTFPRSVGHVPARYYTNVRQYGGRKWTLDDPAPLFPFGFGLSYTRYVYENLRIEPRRIETDGAATVSVDVRNAGSRDGAEIVQLYTQDCLSSVVRPVRQLTDFRRVDIAAGETKTVSFRLDAQSLALYDATAKRVVEPGLFLVNVGPDSQGGLQGVLTVGDTNEKLEALKEYWGDAFVPTPETF